MTFSVPSPSSHPLLDFAGTIIECFRGQEGQFFFIFGLRFSRPYFHAAKWAFLYLKTCTPQCHREPRAAPLDSSIALGQKSCRTKVSRIFRIFVPNFAPNFAPNFPRIFRGLSCFVSWETETRKNSPKIPAIFQCKIPRQTRKKYSQNSSGEQAK